MTDLRALECFAALYHSGSFRLTADALGASQSTVTKSIQRLEKDLGLRLFDRTTRTVIPTDSARQLIDKAEVTLRTAGLFEDEASLLARGEIGGIRVGAIALAAETLLIKGLAKLADTHPSLEVDVVVGSSDIYRDLASGDCDVAVGDEANFTSSPHAPLLRMLPVTQEQLVFVQRAGHPAASATTLAELLHYPLAIPSRYFNENRLFEATALQTPDSISPRYRLNSLSACLSLAATSDVVTLAPRAVAESLLQASTPPVINIAGVSTGISVRLVMVTVARNTPSPAVRAFQDAILSI